MGPCDRSIPMEETIPRDEKYLTFNLNVPIHKKLSKDEISKLIDEKNFELTIGPRDNKYCMLKNVRYEAKYETKVFGYYKTEYYDQFVDLICKILPDMSKESIKDKILLDRGNVVDDEFSNIYDDIKMKLIELKELDDSCEDCLLKKTIRDCIVCTNEGGVLLEIMSIDIERNMDKLIDLIREFNNMT